MNPSHDCNGWQVCCSWALLTLGSTVLSSFATPGPFGWQGVGLDTPEVWFLEAFDVCWSLHRPFSICQWNALDSHHLPDAARLDCRAAAAHDGSPVLALHSFFWSPDGAPTVGLCAAFTEIQCIQIDRP